MSDYNLARVAKLIADEFGEDAATITPATELDALGLDSMDRIELAMTIEDDFGVKLPGGVEMDWETVGDALAWLAPAVQP